jgi:hypothetical protein
MRMLLRVQNNVIYFCYCIIKYRFVSGTGQLFNKQEIYLRRGRQKEREKEKEKGEKK